MKNYKQHLRSIYIITVCVLLFTSCKKESETNTITGEEATLSFSITGIEDQNEFNIKLGSTNKPKTEELTNKTVTSTDLTDDIILETSASTERMESILENNPNHIGDIKSKIQNKLAATSKIETGKTYRVILRNASTNAIERNVIATAGTPLEIAVQKNVNYNWYAFSFNNEDQNLPFNVANFTVGTSATNDFLFAQGTAVVSTNTPNKPLPITFKHKVAMVNVEIDGSGLIGKINNIVAQFGNTNYFNTATIDLNTGSVTGTPVTQNVTAVNFSQQTDHKWSAKYYTTDPSTLPTSIVLNIQSLMVTKLVRTIPTPAPIPSTVDLMTGPNNPITFTFPVSSKAVGNKLNGKLYLISQLPQLTILHSEDRGQGYDTQAGRTGMPNNLDLYNSSNQGNYPNGARLYSWTGFPAFLRHFVRIHSDYNLPPSPYWPNESNYVRYTSGDRALAMKGPLNSIVARTSEPGEELRTKLPSANPDIVIISLHNNDLTPIDVQRLDDFATRGGVVILLADRGQPNPNDSPTHLGTRHTVLLPFIKNQFASPNATLHPYYFLRDEYPIFKLKNLPNDIIMNGYFGNVSNSHWAPGYNNSRAVLGAGMGAEEPGTSAMLFSGLDPSQIVDYSEITYTNATQLGDWVNTADTHIMFRHATKNIFVIGNNDFASDFETNPFENLIHYNQAYRLHYYWAQYPRPNGSADAYPSTYMPITVPSYRNTGIAVDNAKLMGNIMTWALIQASYNGANTY